MLKLYYIREDSGGLCLWSSEEAVLFLGTTRFGYRVSYLTWPWQILRQHLNGVPVPTDKHSRLTVLRVTPSGVERHVLEEAEEPDLYTVLHGQIYANCHGSLCKWSNGRFEEATEEEQRKLDGINRLTNHEFDNVGGWSKKGIGGAPEDIFARSAIDVGGRFTIAEKSDPTGRTGYIAVSIYVQRPGQAPERIWYLDGHPRRVSKAEYERVFGLR